MNCKNLALLAVLLLLVCSLAVSAKETLLMVIDGSVLYNDGVTLVPNGWKVEVTNKTRNLSQSSIIGEAGNGRYSVTFIDILGGVVAATGDEIELVVIDTDGKKRGSMTYTITDEDMNTISATIDIEAGPYPKEFPHWDVNEDGVVDISDLVLVGIHFGENYNGIKAPSWDVNEDGVVDISDLALVSIHFGED
ncbi:MAG: dockerin type I domain-containing protein [Candidatus Poribacteria bacterium]